MRIQIVGRGRMGRALAPALRASGVDASEPAGRGATGRDGATGQAGAFDAVLLAVPDAAIPEAAAAILPGPAVGHLSGATLLSALAPHEQVFSVHPLLTVTGERTDFSGAWAAIDAAGERASLVAAELGAALGLRTFRVADPDRAAYHAAASIASNYLVTVEGAAERLAASAGVPREALLPLARAALDNWAALGAERALTGPIARGDEDTVAAQRAAITERAPGDLGLFDALADATRRLAADARRGAQKDGDAP
ncbi:DUF2520 domain-containing protein [Leucobacter luti]|uniref:DUF2520 domain-containing protein n=1 Tax=Leucobacter luti TaxID=340320 RepID=UPI003D06469A